MLKYLLANPEGTVVFRVAWTRRKHNSLRLNLADLFQGYFVISADDNFCAYLPYVLGKVVHETVVIIDYQHLQRPSPPANSRAFINACAFVSVSNHSRSGIESATIPAPA